MRGETRPGRAALQHWGNDHGDHEGDGESQQQTCMRWEALWMDAWISSRMTTPKESTNKIQSLYL